MKTTWFVFEVITVAIALVGFPVFTYFLLTSEAEAFGKGLGAFAAVSMMIIVLFAMAKGVLLRR